MTALAETLEQVSPDQIKHFDHDAQHLVMDYHLAGWRSHMTSNGHVFLKAPDGSETASVSRESLRGRSGRNAAAPLKRWRRRQQAEWEAERKRKRAGSTFGITDMDEVRVQEIPSLDNHMPPRVAAALKNHPDITEYIRQNEDRFDGPKAMQESLYIGIDYDSEKPPWEMWTMVDTDRQVLVAYGPGYTRDEALRMLRAEGKLRPATEEEIMAAAQGTTCPECGFKAANVGSLNMHVKIKHTGFICPECGKNTGHAGRSLAVHRKTEHGVTPAFAAKREARAKRSNVCPDCGEGFLTPQAAAQHRRHMHERDVTGDVLALATSLGRPLHRPDLVEHLGLGLHTAGTTLGRMTQKGLLVRTKRGEYELPHPPEDVPVTSHVVPEPVTPERDSESVTSAPVDAPVDMVTQVQRIVSAPLLAQLAELRAQNEDLRHENEKLAKQLADADALLGMLNDYKNQRSGGGA